MADPVDVAASPETRAVVVGASVAGLLSARALADEFAQVVVVERERLDDTPEPRGHVPQGRHLHLLLGAGLERLTAWFPGIAEELEDLGAVRLDGTHAWLFQAGAYRAQGDWGPSVLSMTRPLLEQVLRRRVRALPNVEVEDGRLVDRLTTEGRRVTGVVVDGHERAADLVVDCSGRSSRIAHQLESAGYLAPPVSRVTIDCAYATRFLPWSPDDFEGAFIVVATSPPNSFRGGVALPVEGGRWLVTLAGVHGEVPGTDDQGFLDFARSLLSPVVAQLIDRCTPTGPIASYRFPSSQRRHYEKVRDLPAGLVTVGDAACSFDPVYGQGMACAALQAEALGEAVRTTGHRSPDLPIAFHRRAAKILDAPWAIAVGADFLHPMTSGPKSRGTDAVNRYVLKVLLASHTSLPVARTFNLVLQLLEPPSALMRPRMVSRVLSAARRSPVATGAPVRHPHVSAPTPS